MVLLNTDASEKGHAENNDDSHGVMRVAATPGQQSLWWLGNTLAQPECYNVPVLVGIDAPLNAASMEQAVAALSLRHAIFRTRFIHLDNELRQCIDDESQILFSHQKIADSASPETVMKRLASSHFSLSDGPLSVIKMLSTSTEKTWLACCFHHIIIDAPSVRIVLRELLQLYCAINQNKGLPTESVAEGYLAFTHWQSAMLAEPETVGMRTYWRDLLQPAPPLTDLPVDFPRKLQEDISADRAMLTLSEGEADTLQRQARKLSMTTFMYLTMCWQFFLHRMTGQDDITVGVPFTLRDRSEFEDTPGYMINTLPIRVKIASSDQVKQFAAQVRERFIGAHINKNIPFNEIVALSEENAGQDSPLFRTLLVMPDTKVGIFDDLPFGVTLNDYFSQAAKYDLTLFLEMQPEWKLTVEYKTALFHPDTMDYWLQIFRRLLVEMGQNGEATLASLALLDSPMQRVLMTRSSREHSTGTSPNALGLFNRFAREHPEHTALITDAETRSYSWLAKRSNRIAACLHQRHRIGVGSRVALLLERNVDAIAALLGVLKTGAAYLPIDPQYPQERISYMLQDASADCIVTTVELSKAFAATSSVPLFLVDNFIEDNSAAWSGVERMPDDELYIIYTSGSTGWPKGVRLLNKTLNNLVEWQQGISDCGPGDCTLHFMSLSFDVSVQEIFGTLAYGGKLYIASEDERKDLDHLQEVIQRREINRLYFPYVALQQFAHLSGLAHRTFPHLKEVYSTGEQLVLTADIKKFFRQPIRLVNLYGPSESHVCSACILPERSECWGDAASIGFPLPGFTLLAVDENLRAVPAGVAGELLIISDFLSPGYHNKAVESTQRFLNVAGFAAQSHKAYRTGDLIKLENDDTFSYLGRIDNQLKIRGFRIEPSEVEAAINALEGVQVSAVVGKQTTPGSKQLVAFIAGPSNDQKAPILHQLRLRLPEYMVPSELVFLDKLPTTPSGKIDRKALLEMAIPVDSFVPAADEPLTEMQRRVKALWLPLFPGRRIELHDDFFAIGGHSLLATQLVFLLRKAFDIDIPLRLLFNHPTLSAMAASVDRYLAEDKGEDTPKDHSFVRDGYAHFPWQSAGNVSTGESGATLLTGATGFLGIYLLRSLLLASSKPILCIVRAESGEHAMTRLRDNALRYGIADDIDFSRVKIYLGDIGKPCMGLTHEEYHSLSVSVDTVFHAAAQINFLLSYSSVKETNVQGTQNVINFCGNMARKKLNYISTIAVFSPRYPEQPISEVCMPEYPEALSIGYTQSKWVAERCVMQAREQGLAVNIFRIGRIGGDSRTGACQPDDFLWRQIKSFIQMGLAPEASALSTDLLPVDFVADALVALADLSTSRCDNFHLFHPCGTHFEPVYRAIRRLGYPLEITSDKVWLKHLEDFVQQGREVALGPVIHLFNEDSLDTGDNAYLNNFTAQRIVQVGLRIPELTEAAFVRMISYFQQQGDIPKEMPC